MSWVFQPQKVERAKKKSLYGRISTRKTFPKLKLKVVLEFRETNVRLELKLSP
jgi:hypothetical protein